MTTEVTPTLADLAAELAEIEAAIAAEPAFPDPAADLRDAIRAGMDAAAFEPPSDPTI